MPVTGTFLNDSRFTRLLFGKAPTLEWRRHR